MWRKYPIDHCEQSVRLGNEGCYSRHSEHSDGYTASHAGGWDGKHVELPVRIILVFFLMTRFYSPRSAAYGHQTQLDSIVKDGLTDAYDNIHMVP